jgi:cytochrome oxidase Cu insertion factor (SCO1/SenC/PrrC family)
MKFSKKHFYILTALVILLSGIYVIGKNLTNAPDDTIGSNAVKTASNISGLMTSMNIHHIIEQREAPDFDLRSLDDRRVQLNQYRGKVVLLSFWATW